MKHGQQDEGGDSIPLFSALPPGVLHPALVPLEQEKQGCVEVDPEEGCENHLWGGTTYLGRLRELGFLRPGE